MCIRDRYKSAQVPLPGGCNIGSRPIDQHIKGFRALGAEVVIERGTVFAHAIDLVASHIYLDAVSYTHLIRAIKNEALNKAIESGATAESVEIHVEIDPQTSKVTAIATGSTEVKTTDLLKECDESEARHLAAEDMRVADDEAHLLASTPYFYVYGNQADPLTAGAVRIVDKKGFIKVQRGRGMCILSLIHI